MDDVKECVLEYLGFINWWSSSISGWEDPLQRWMVDFIAGFKLQDLKKKGVFLDLLSQWRTLNVAHLLAKNVPVYYFWQEDMDDYPCFTQLSPSILQAYHDTCGALDRTEVLGDDKVGLQDDIETIRSYDNFFQLRCVPDHTVSPTYSGIPLRAVVSICDFEGWSAQQLLDPILIHNYADKYHLAIEVDKRDTYITIWCWKPR